MTLPDDIAALVASLDAVDAAATRLAAPLSEAQFNWQPREGRGWSIGQCLDHLRISGAVYLPAMERAAQDASARGLGRTGPLRAGGWPSKWFISIMGPQSRVRTKAPGKIAPASSLAKDATLASFHEVIAQFRQFATRHADLDLNAVRFANPLVRGIRFTAATGLLIIEAHNRRHLRQAEQVAQAEGFPR